MLAPNRLADAVMLLHFSFLLFVALGGFLAWRHPIALAPHIAAVAWGLTTALLGLPCPLTAWENRFRVLAGQQGLGDGFVATYLTGVIYPQQHLRTAQLLVAAVVVVSWIGWGVRRSRGQWLSRGTPRSATR